MIKSAVHSLSREGGGACEQRGQGDPFGHGGHDSIAWHGGHAATWNIAQNAPRHASLRTDVAPRLMADLVEWYLMASCRKTVGMKFVLDSDLNQGLANLR